MKNLIENLKTSEIKNNEKYVELIRLLTICEKNERIIQCKNKSF